MSWNAFPTSGVVIALLDLDHLLVALPFFILVRFRRCVRLAIKRLFTWLHRALLFERICLTPFSTIGILVIRIIARWLVIPTLYGKRWEKFSILRDGFPCELIAEVDEWGLLAALAHPLRLRAVH